MGPSIEGYKRLRQIVVLHVQHTKRAYYHPFRAAIGQVKLNFNTTAFRILHGPGTARHRPALVDTRSLPEKASNWAPIPAWPAGKLGKPCLPYNIEYLRIHDILKAY